MKKTSRYVIALLANLDYNGLKQFNNLHYFLFYFGVAKTNRRVSAERPLGPNLCRLVKKKMRFTVTYTMGLTTNGLSTIFLSLIMMIVTATWLYAY